MKGSITSIEIIRGNLESKFYNTIEGGIMIFDKFNIRNKILVGTGISIVLMILVSTVVYFNVKKIQETNQWVEFTHEVFDLSNSLVLDMINMETGMRGFLVTGDEKFLEPYKNGKQDFDLIMPEIKKKVSHNPSQVATLEEIDTLSRQWRQEIADTMIQKRQEVNNVPAKFNDLVSLVRKAKGKILMDEIREKIKAFDKIERELLAVRKNESLSAGTRTYLIIVLGTGLSIVLGFFSTFYIARKISDPLKKLVRIFQEMSKGDLEKEVSVVGADEIGKLGQAFNEMVNNLKQKVILADQISNGDLTVKVPLASQADSLGNSFVKMLDNWSKIIGEMKEGSMHLTASTNEISAGAIQQLRNITSQGRAINDFSAGINELSATSTELGRNTEGIVETSRLSIELASKGNEAVEKSLTSMEDIQTTNQGTSEKFSSLVNKVESIAKVLESITSIADKTNLLSVNASIESVKAGEYGKGFGVVASEIRRLADQTVGASQEISAIISDIQKAANEAMMSMEKLGVATQTGLFTVKETGTVFKDLIVSVKNMGPSLEEMKTAVEQQSENTTRLSEVLQQIQRDAEESKTASEQISETTAGLSEMAQQQLGTVKIFKIIQQRADA